MSPPPRVAERALRLTDDRCRLGRNLIATQARRAKAALADVDARNMALIGAAAVAS
jgi:hypothetical protein